MDHEQQDLLAQFLSITGSDEGMALSILEATNWNLTQAIDLFLGSSEHHNPSPQTAPDQGHNDDNVRAPIPSKVDRLYDAVTIPMGAQPRYGQPGKSKQAVQMDAFRDFRAESQQQAGASGRPPAGGSKASLGLADLYKPPRELIFAGSFDQAKATAAKDGKWLLINIQSGDEFASHQLNSDTWAHEMVRDVVKGIFVFVQVYAQAPEGQQLQTAYRVEQLPVIFIVDPLTGAKMNEWRGFVEPSKLVDDLVPFMDHGPKDAGASYLAQASLKRKFRSSGSGTGLSGPVSNGAQPVTGQNEDDDLALAIAMSLKESRGAPSDIRVGRTQRSYDDDDDNGVYLEDSDEEGDDNSEEEEEVEDDDDVVMEEEVEELVPGEGPEAESVPTALTPEDIRAQAQGRLSPEPSETSSSVCRMAVRLPDGSRIIRKFNASDPISSLYDWCIVEGKEVAEKLAGGTKFTLIPSLPGSAPIEDQSASLTNANVAGAMLLFKWMD